MALSTFAELKAAVASYLERSDLTSAIADGYTLARAKANRGMMAPDGRTWIVPPLRVRDMITTANITITDGSGSLPTGWLEFVRLWIDASGQPNLKYVPQEIFFDYQGAHESADQMLGYTIEGSTIRTMGAGSDTLKSVHYAAFTAMSADASADWVLTNAPHVWLHGILAEVWTFIDGAEAREMKHQALFASGIHALNAEFGRAQHSGSALIMQPKAVV